ncbi:MAG: toll/interleukin-1 receptor domain-containing protein [Bacteroidales bacterium]|nr:toll/interleukin-1 receptor domain-containing protein [Bacteroidales bacterium]
MSQKKYDIFISYRRESFSQANLICTRLKALGYRVFIDVEALNSGKFNEQLLSVIKNCKDFIAVLPPNALDRCVSEDDWVRREVMCAMENHKNIIPIMLAGFAWPDPMPKGMEDLCMYQSLAPMPDVYFDMQIKKLQGYLKSKAYYMKRRRWIVGSAIAVAVLALLLVIANAIYKPMAKRLSDSLFVRTQAMVNLDEINNAAFNEWSSYLKDYSEATNQEDKDDYKNLLLKQLALNEKETDNLLKNVQRSKIEVSEFYYPLLWLHGINPYDVNEIDAYTESCFDEVSSTFDKYRETADLIEGEIAHWVPQAVTPYLSMLKLDYMTNHTVVEAYYYTYLMLLTHLPESTHDKFYKMSTKWETMPQTGLGLSDKEYERLVNMAYDRCDKQLNEHQRLQQEAENLLDIINAQLENLLKEGGMEE